MLQIIPLLPTPSETTSLNLLKASIALGSIPEDYKTKHDLFKRSLFLTCQTGLLVKELDTDGDGQVSVLEALDLTTANADIFYNALGQLTDISSMLSTMDPESKMGETTQKVSAVKTEVDSMPGNSIEEKIENYLSKDENPTHCPRKMKTKTIFPRKMKIKTIFPHLFPRKVKNKINLF